MDEKFRQLFNKLTVREVLLFLCMYLMKVGIVDESEFVRLLGLYTENRKKEAEHGQR